MIQDFLSIGVVGVLLSLAIEFISTKFDIHGTAARGLTLALAIAVGSLYVWLQGTQYFQTVITVLTVSSTVYAFFLKKG